MNNDDVLDPPRSKLRALARKLDEQIALLGAGAAGSSGTAQAWLELSLALDLGEEPALRACPHCGRRIIKEATRCRYCMATSPAPSREPAP